MKDHSMYKQPMNSRVRTIYVLMFIAVGFLATFTAEPVLADELVPLVVINDDTVSTTDVDQQLVKMHRTIAPDKRDSFDYSILINKLVNDRLIIQEAVAIGMDTEDQIIESLDEVRMREARNVYVREAFSYDSSISDKDIRDYFTRNYFKVKLRTLASADCETVANYAEMITSGTPMDSLAKAVSLDTRRYLGGAQSLRFWITVDPQTQKRVENLEVGEICQPFPYKDACMIIRVDERVSADTTELPPLLDGIKRALDKEHRLIAWEQLIDSLTQASAVRIDSLVLQDIQNDSALVFRSEFLEGSDRPLISASDFDGLTENELRRKISHKAMNASDKSFREILQLAISETSEQIVLNAAAKSLRTTEDPRVLEKVRKTADSLMIEEYLQENVVSKIEFNRDQFTEYYKEHSEQFRETGEIRLYDLQLKDEETAKIAMERLSEGADFGYVKKELGMTDGVVHNEDAWMKADQYPEQISAQLDSLAVGEYTHPLALTTGWVIFKVRDRRPGKLKSIEEVDMQIREIMFQREFTRMLDDVLATLKEHSDIKYFDDNIDAYFGADSDS
ncbi:MAG: peptidyl-prolyl cis-trans isomerase [bacterium]|nr:peptidyl-prolyl cis-trans isomerase [bacterium]